MYSMKNSTEIQETIRAGDMASIENTAAKELSISLVCGEGCRVDLELAPGQVLELSAGSLDVQVILHRGDPASLLIIKPDSAS